MPWPKTISLAKSFASTCWSWSRHMSGPVSVPVAVVALLLPTIFTKTKITLAVIAYLSVWVWCHDKVKKLKLDLVAQNTANLKEKDRHEEAMSALDFRLKLAETQV